MCKIDALSGQRGRSSLKTAERVRAEKDPFARVLREYPSPVSRASLTGYIETGSSYKTVLASGRGACGLFHSAAHHSPDPRCGGGGERRAGGPGPAEGSARHRFQREGRAADLLGGGHLRANLRGGKGGFGDGQSVCAADPQPAQNQREAIESHISSQAWPCCFMSASPPADFLGRQPARFTPGGVDAPERSGLRLRQTR